MAFEEGEVIRLKKTGGGMLLEMSRLIEPGNIIEVIFGSSTSRPTTSVLEVCWSDRLFHSRRQRYLVGCRSLFSS